MFERPTRDRNAGETWAQTIRRWRLILYFPLLGAGALLYLMWPSLQHLFRPRSGSCTRPLAGSEIAALTGLPEVSPEVDKDSDRCRARYGDLATVEVRGGKWSSFEDAVWELSYKKRSEFARLPGAARAFVGIDEDGRGRLIRLLDSGRYLDLLLAPPAGIAGLRRAAALLDDGRLAHFDPGFPAPVAKAESPGRCGTLLKAADVPALGSPPRELDLVHLAETSAEICSGDVLVGGDDAVMVSYFASSIGGSYPDNLQKLRQEGREVEPLAGIGPTVAYVHAADGFEEIVLGLTEGVASITVRDPQVPRASLVALAGRVAAASPK
jgi:hypothetical protein